MSNEKICPFCAETIKAAASLCRHCGRSLDAAPQRSTEATPVSAAPARRRWPLVLLGAVGALILFVLVAGHEPAEGSATGARAICEKFISSTLRDPSSAEWVDSHRWPTQKDGVGWVVDVEYRARNGFGGMNHERKSCKVMHTGGGNWRLVDMK